MRGHLHAEWTKLRTTSGAGWLLVALVTLTVAVSAVASASLTCSRVGCDHDAVKLSLTGVQLGQALVAVLAVVAIGDEYGTGMIRTTFAAMPRRAAVLTAKAALVTGLTLAASIPAVLGSVLAGRLILPGRGLTPGHGYPPLSLADGPTLRAAGGSVLYLALIALIGLGVATVLRDSAVAIGAVLALLYGLPVAVALVANPDWRRWLWEVSPMSAGLAVQATTHLADLPLTGWAGLGVPTAWALAALLAGGLTLRLRDA